MAYSARRTWIDLLIAAVVAFSAVTQSPSPLAARIANHTALPNDPDAAQDAAGQALGEIAAAGSESLP